MVEFTFWKRVKSIFKKGDMNFFYFEFEFLLEISSMTDQHDLLCFYFLVFAALPMF